MLARFLGYELGVGQQRNKANQACCSNGTHGKAAFQELVFKFVRIFPLPAVQQPGDQPGDNPI